MKKKLKPRSWIAQSAHRVGAGTHNDKRKKREGTRKQQKERAMLHGEG